MTIADAVRSELAEAEIEQAAAVRYLTQAARAAAVAGTEVLPGNRATEYRAKRARAQARRAVVVADAAVARVDSARAGMSALGITSEIWNAD